MIRLAAVPLALALRAAAPAEGPARCPAAGPDAGWCQALAARARLPLASAEEVAALRAVYARPELRQARADPAALRRLAAGLWGRILELFGSAEAERYASVGRAIFVAAGLAAALAAFAAVRRRGARAASREPAAPAGQPTLQAPDRSDALAREALGRGDLPGAVRHAFLSALAALEACGRLPRDRTLTNAELARRLAGSGVGAEFAALGRSFDVAIYGRVPPTPPEAREALARALRIRAGLGEAA